ncbi:MAG: DUF58 domain-containing protein [Anaerolineales bacterium]|nr:DUF58 domain-containing protein [Anaerolineales bacterium]
MFKFSLSRIIASPSQRVVWGLLGLCLLALAITGAEVYSRLAYVWGILLAGSWLWSVLSLRGLKIVRHPRLRRAHLGQIFEERFEVQNNGQIPRLWLEIKDLSPLPGSRGSHVVTLIGARQRRSYLARSRLMQRGIFPLGPTQIVSGDPFGLFPVERQLPVEETLLVYPMMVDIQTFPNPPGVLTGGEALRQRTHYVTPNAAGVREYAPGDSLNRIHWPTTVRRDKLMVKEFELDPQADIWIFVDAEKAIHTAMPYSVADLSKNVFLQEQLEEIKLPPSTEEYAASIAASLGRFYLRKRRAVGVVLSGQSNTVLPPDRGGRQLNKMLESLAVFRAEGKLPLSGLLEAQARHITRGSTVILITPTVREQFAFTLEFLNRRGLRPIVVLLDAETFGGAPGSTKLAHMVKAMGVPVRRVENGKDIREGLISQF